MATYDDYGQPPQPGGYQEPQYYGPTGSSGKAVISMILGLMSFCLCCVTGIPAVILGFMGLSDVRNSGGRLGGTGMAVIGIITGLLGTFCGLGCIGFGWFSIVMMQEMAKAELNANPIVQEHLGEIESCTFNWTDMMEERQKEKDRIRQNELWSFDLEGTKGKGLARVRMKQEGDKMRLLGGTLELSDGRVLDLLPGVQQ
ncbi:MAG: DUF4190 domain-containing protein [Gemmatales bacterium]|nr:DUF4190 domain-containing protein [Gemmatales bacterium]MDW8386524.1 DUF4190 domain-containing protein [Gemmatales bacterium]